MLQNNPMNCLCYSFETILRLTSNVGSLSNTYFKNGYMFVLMLSIKQTDASLIYVGGVKTRSKVFVLSMPIINGS